jgi:gas vesicle protein GvpO
VTREEKAALRAKERDKRRNPKDEEESHNGDKPTQQEDAPQREERPRAKREPLKGAKGGEIADMATQARELLRSVRGVEAESVSGITRTQNGWKVMLEVVELRRIPESTDVLASYEVELDGEGKFLGFQRGSRYSRSQAGAGDGR